VVKWLFEFKCRNSCLDVDDMIMYMNWMIICYWWWVLHAKSYICGYVMFLCKIDEKWSCGCWIMSGFMTICCWCCFETCCWWIDSMGFPICELVMRIVVIVEYFESLVNYWILIKWCFNLKFYASLSLFSCIWPVNIIWNEFWVGKDQNWDFWGKMVWNPEFFD